MNSNLFPSLLSVSYFEHKAIIAYLDSSPVVSGLHVDVMDDHFVDNMGFSPRMIADIAQLTKKPIWVHLMVDNPDKWVSRLCQSLRSGDMVTLHTEVIPKSDVISSLIQKFRLCNLRIGLAINPETALSDVIPYFPFIDHLLIMTVTPGFGGQDFLENMQEKIEEAIATITTQDRQIRLGVDGGITAEWYKKLKQIGVSYFAVGSGLFAQKRSYQDMLSLFRYR